MSSKWRKYDNLVNEVIEDSPNLKYSKIAREVFTRSGIEFTERDVDLFRTYIKRNFYIGKKKPIQEEITAVGTVSVEVTSDSFTNSYKGTPMRLSALTSDGRIMNINEYCEYHNLDRTTVDSCKLISHTGTPYYNIVFKDGIAPKRTLEELLEGIKERVSTYDKRIARKQSKHNKQSKLQVLADIHIGQKTKEDPLAQLERYDVDIAIEKLRTIADTINEQNNAENVVIINGDVLECVNLMHTTQAFELDSDYVGANGIILAADIIHTHFLSRIDNLGTVYFPSSNHGRLSGRDKEAGERGSAEHLISYILELRGYDTFYAPSIGKFKIGNISILYTHGQLKLASKSSDHIINTFGYKDEDYTVIVSAHIHNHKSKEYSTVLGSSKGYIHLVAPALTSGNIYSADAGYSDSTGFLTVWEAPNRKAHYTKYSI